MDIKWIGAHSNNYTVGRGGKSIKTITMHWIVGTLESCDATFANPDRKASAHYGIGDSDIHQYVKEEDTSWGASNWGINQTTINIEHEGGWLLQDGTRFKPTDSTHQTSAKLVADICRRYSLPINRETIHLHNEYSATACPGLLDVNRIIELAIKENAPVPTPPAIDPVDANTLKFLKESFPNIKTPDGKPYGNLESMARGLVATYNDYLNLKTEFDLYKSGAEARCNEAIELAKPAVAEFYKVELAKKDETVSILESQTAENLDWKTLFSIAWKKWWAFRKNE